MKESNIFKMLFGNVEGESKTYDHTFIPKWTPKEMLRSLVVWDLETTGFTENPNARIIEIGAQVIRDGELVSSHKWLLNHGIDIPEEISKITGITKEDIEKDGVDPKNALDEFITILSESEFNLTHNGFRFDIPFLEKELYNFAGWDFIIKHFREYLEMRGIDTAVLYKAKKLGLTQKEDETFKQFADRVMEIRAYGVKYNVGICCDELGIDRTNITQHRADADVFLTGEIFKKMVL